MIIAIASGKGGTGKTSLTAALWSNIVIADCDVDAADLRLLLNPDIQKTTDFYAGVRAVIDQNQCTHCGQCREVCVYDAIAPPITSSTTSPAKAAASVIISVLKGPYGSKIVSAENGIARKRGSAPCSTPDWASPKRTPASW